MNTIAVVGNPKAGSRTLVVAEAIAARLAAGVGIPAFGPPTGASSMVVIDLAEYVDELFDWDSARVGALVEMVLGADRLVVASPTYKATYTGLLKVFLDRVAGGALAGTIAAPVMVAGAAEHALAVETHLRPLLVELGATCLTPGLCVLERDLDDLDAVIETWWSRVEPVLSRLTGPAAPALPPHAT